MKKRKKYAVSELFGALLLLAIVIAAMALVFFYLSSDKGPHTQTYVKLVGKIEQNNLIVEHQGGESIGLDTKISLSYADRSYNFIVSDLLIDDNHNGFWNLGEKMIFPFTYDLDNLSKYDNIDIMSVDVDSNSIQFLGSVEFHPTVDLGLETMMSDSTPKKYDYINATISLAYYGGDINGSADIQVLCLIPDGLRYISSTSDSGTYDNTTGIWFIDQLRYDTTLTLNIRLQVVSKGIREFTQLALILDGSGSIISTDWNLMRTGFAMSIANSSVFPNDKSVELTVVQFGGSSPPHAEIEISPTIVNNYSGTPGYFQTISNHFTTLSQLKGYTPMGCGIRLATDQVYTVGKYSDSTRQILIMVTDGLANCNWIPDTYNGEHKDNNIGKTATEEAVDYLKTTLDLDFGQDEFDVLAVLAGSDPPDITWLNNSIVWPQPGHIAPPFKKQSGWVSAVTTWQDFIDRIAQIFRLLFQSITFKAEIIRAFTTDPYLLNNIDIQVITPST